MEDSGQYTSDQFDATGQSKAQEMQKVAEPEPVNVVNEEDNAQDEQDEGVYVDEGEEVEEIDENPGETAQNEDLMMMVNDIGDVQSHL